MLKKLRIQNFKVWEDTGEICMAPITLFFGVNSSGKSSIGQFLMMLKQTIGKQDRRAVLYPGDRHSAVQLGTFREMVHGHDTKREIEFSYQWSLPQTYRFKDPDSKQEISGDVLSFEAEVGLKKQRGADAPVVSRFKYCLSDSKEASSISIGMAQGNDKDSKYKVESESYNLAKRQGRPGSLGFPVQFYGFPDQVVAYHKNADFTKDLNQHHVELFKSLSYLGPLRNKAERLYSWGGDEPSSVGYSGEYTIAAILGAKNREINCGPHKRYKKFEEIIAEKLKEMNLIEEFSIKLISKHRREYEVKVRTKGTREAVDLPDVGFGIAQVLPVLVECFYAPPGSIVLIEQPEIHLHPAAQSTLADVTIDAINARENGADRNIQLIIETHSEHFLRRLQRRIAEEDEIGQKIAAYFADVTKEPANLEPLQIDNCGYITNWPNEFFGDEMGDMIEHSKAALKKRKKSGNTASVASE